MQTIPNIIIKYIIAGLIAINLGITNIPSRLKIIWTIILPTNDEQTFRKLGIDITCDAVYPSESLYY